MNTSFISGQHLVGIQSQSLQLEISTYNGGTKIENLANYPSPIYVGRPDPDSNHIPTICIRDDVVSRKHFDITRDNQGQYHLIVRKTSNGLMYKDKKLEPGDDRLLEYGDIYSIGNAEGRVVTLTFTHTNQGAQSDVPYVHPIYLGKNRVKLECCQNNQGLSSKKIIHLNDPHVLGYCIVKIDRKKTGHLISYDGGNTGHIYIDDKLVNGEEVLTPGCRLRIGAFTFIYTGSQLVQYDGSEINIQAYKLHRKNGGKLEDIYLAIPPRKFVAIVGGSGTGKSTLLKALNGVQPVDGTILYNGDDYYKSRTHYSTHIGYVPQEDIVHKGLTVKDAIYYSANLRLPRYYTQKMIEDRIDEVLEKVQLGEEDIKIKPVEKLSGGQRKRFSIALELLTEPKILFLDEPTSALDVGLERHIMQVLRGLADKGHTIVLVTHATANLHLCDYVCFLAEGGRVVYFGPPKEALPFFDKELRWEERIRRGERIKDADKFADIFSSLDTSVTQKSSASIDAKKRFGESIEYQGYLKFLRGNHNKITQQRQLPKLLKQQPATQPKRSSFAPLWQWWYLCLRYVKLLKNDYLNLGLLLLQAPIIAGLLWCFISFGQLTGVFNPSKVIQCSVTAKAAIELGIRDTSTVDNPKITMSCSQLEQDLTKGNGKIYAVKHGGTRQALQNFIIQGTTFSTVILFVMAFAAIMFGCINSVREIIKEIDIYKRERDVGVGILPYLGSKVAVLAVFCLIQTGILVGFVNLPFLDPFGQGIFLPGWIEVWITLWLTSLVGLMIGLFISAIVNKNEWAMSSIPLLLLPQVVFAGAIFPLTENVLQIIGFFIPLRWSMAALSSSIGLHVADTKDHLIGTTATYQGTIYSIYSQAEARDYLLWHLWLGLGIMIIIYFCLAYCILLAKKMHLPKKATPTEIPCGESHQQGKKFCSHCGLSLQ